MKTKPQVTNEIQYNSDFESKVRKGINLANHNQTLVQEVPQASDDSQYNPEFERKVRKGVNLANHNQTLIIDRG